MWSYDNWYFQVAKPLRPHSRKDCNTNIAPNIILFLISLLLYFLFQHTFMLYRWRSCQTWCHFLFSLVVFSKSFLLTTVKQRMCGQKLRAILCIHVAYCTIFMCMPMSWNNCFLDIIKRGRVARDHHHKVVLVLCLDGSFDPWKEGWCCMQVVL